MGSSPTGHPTKNPLLLCNGGFFLWWGVQWDENRAAVRSTVSNQPSGLLLSPRVPTIRNVYRGPFHQLFATADFFFGGVPSGTRKARHCRRQGNKQPSGLFVSARVPTIRNVYRGPTLQLSLTADFFFGGVPSGTRKARHCRRQGNKQPSGLFVSARVPTIRNVYRGPALFGGVPSWLEPKITDTAAEASII